MNPFECSPELSDGCSTSWPLRLGPGKSQKGGREGYVVFLQRNWPLKFAGLGSMSGRKRLKDFTKPFLVCLYKLTPICCV